MSKQLAHITALHIFLCASPAIANAEALALAKAADRMELSNGYLHNTVNRTTSTQLRGKGLSIFKADQIDLSVGFSYARSTRRENLRVQKNRAASIPIDIGMDFGEKLYLSAGFALIYSEQEFVTFNDYERITSADIDSAALGMSYRLRSETDNFPAISAALNIGIPTDSDSANVETDDIESDGDNYVAGISLNFARTVDPVSLFWNIGYVHIFNDNDDQSFSTLRGDSFKYGFGASFSVNSVIAFNTRLSGTYEDEVSINGITLEGSSSEPLYLDLSTDYSASANRRWTTRISQGLNDDAGDFQFSITTTFAL